MGTNQILFFSILMNVIFVIIFFGMIYFGKAIWIEIVQYNKKIDHLAQYQHAEETTIENLE